MKLTAYNALESHRMPRLKVVAEMLNYRLRGADNVAELHDHKGELTVHWRRHPDEHEIAAANEAWGYVCEWDVKHRHDGALVAETEPPRG
jgi:hypothetical protein